MIEVADVFRRFAADYLNAHGAAMPPSYRRVLLQSWRWCPAWV
jgi:hypothetical protein